VSDAPDELEALRRENRLLARKLARLTENTRQLEAIRDGNATLLSRLMQELDTERARSHELLLNVLPQHGAHDSGPPRNASRTSPCRSSERISRAA